MRSRVRVSPLNAIRRVLLGSFDFEGRARRNDGVLYYFLVALFGWVAASAMTIIGKPVMPDASQSPEFLAIVMIAQIPLVAWFVRRLHDQGRSGWFALIVPISLALVEPLQGSLIGSVILIALALVFVAFVFWPPMKNSNRFGPNPRLDPEGSVANSES